MVLLYLRLSVHLDPSHSALLTMFTFSECPMLNVMEDISLECGLVSWVMVVQ